MLKNQFTNYGDKMFDKDTATIVKNHSLWASICVMIPLFGFEVIPFVIILWHMYSKLCERAGKKLDIGSIIVGIITNFIIGLILFLVFDFFPILYILKWLPTYLQFYLSGKAFIETLKEF